MTAPTRPSTARVPFPNERAMCLWMDVHKARLLATLSRPQLHAAWEADALGSKTEGHRAKKDDLARDLAHNDASQLSTDWHPAMLRDRYFLESLDRSEARVRAAGTPVRWATDPEPTPEAPCPFDARGEHGWRAKTPTCVTCGVDMSEAQAAAMEAERQKYAAIHATMLAGRAARDAARTVTPRP